MGFVIHYFIMSENQYFRAGTGTIIYNDQNQILLFQRANKPEVWQLQQGGMDSGETVEETLSRELFEETGLTLSDTREVLPYPTWLQYEYPEVIKAQMKDQNCLGQTHRWYFLKLKPGIEIDVTKAEHAEFIDSRWSTFEELLSLSDTLKHAVYTELAHYFKANIAK